MATDWTAIKTEYINGAEYPALAKRHKIKEATLRQRASRNKWSQERQKASQAVTTKATAVLVESRAEQLANFNADDVRVAKAIRAKAAKLLQAATTPHELRALAGAFDSAQKIGRLALGATTENNGLSSPGGGPVQSVSMSQTEFRQIAKQISSEI